MKLSSVIAITAVATGAVAHSGYPDNLLNMMNKRDATEVLSAIASNPSVKALVESLGSSDSPLANLDLSSIISTVKSSPYYSQALAYAAENPDLLATALEYAEKLGLYSSKKRDLSTIVSALGGAAAAKAFITAAIAGNADLSSAEKTKLTDNFNSIDFSQVWTTVKAKVEDFVADEPELASKKRDAVEELVGNVFALL